MTIIDIHTHMMHPAWVAAIGNHPGYGLSEAAGTKMIALNGRPYMPVEAEMLDYGRRIADMDKAGVDVAIVSLTTPSVYWAEAEMAAKLARTANDDMAERQAAWTDRIRFLATLPWQYPDAALAELDHAAGLGAAGIFVGANIEGLSLTDPALAPIWAATFRWAPAHWWVLAPASFRASQSERRRRWAPERLSPGTYRPE